MTYAEYENMINRIVSEPETAPVGAQALLDQLKTDLEAMDAAIAGIAERDEKIRALQDTNIKLFMSQTGATEEPEEEEPEDLDFEALVKSKMEEAK